MTRYLTTVLTGLVAVTACVTTGCATAGREKTYVQLTYDVAPQQALPPDAKVIAVLPAKITVSHAMRAHHGDLDWSEMAASIIENQLQDMSTRYGTELAFVNRTNLKPVLDEQDLVLSGMTNADVTSESVEQSLALKQADVLVESTISISMESKTKSGLDVTSMVSSRFPRSRTRSVHYVTVHCTIRLNYLDGSQPYVHQGRVAADNDSDLPFTVPGVGKDLPPIAHLTCALIEKEAKAFVAKIIPHAEDYYVKVESDKDAMSITAVKLARIEDYTAAYDSFLDSYQADPENHRAAFGAGVMAECLGRHEKAASHYKQALMLKSETEYVEAKDRIQHVNELSESGRLLSHSATALKSRPKDDE